MTFSDCVSLVLKFEGGYVNDPNDVGGETRWGISKRAFPNLNIRDLTREEAIELYRIFYWDRMQCDSLPPEIRLAVFDCAVNQGLTRATLFLQKSVGVKADGVLGPRTIEAFRGVPPEVFLANFLNRRFDAYVGNPQWSVYGRGWMKRLFEVTLRSLA